MKKRAASFLLALALLVQLLPVSALATEVTEGAVSGTEEAAVAAAGENFCGGLDGTGENATWSFDAASGTLTISGSGEVGNCDAWKSLGPIITVEIGEGITSVGAIFSWWDYWNAPSVGTLKLPASLTSLDPGAFSYGKLGEISVAEGSRHYASRDGVLFSGDGKVLCKYPADRSGTSYTVPDSVERLETNAFSYCNTLAEVHLPEGLKTIGSTVFFASNHIAQIDLPASVTTLEDSAFAQSSCNISIHPDSRLETIGNYVFQGNYSITSLTLPSTLQTIGKYTFPESKGGFSGLTILSRDVVIDASNAEQLRAVSIIGYTGSTVEAFANENGLTFVDIDRAALTGAGKTVGWLYGDRGAKEPNYAAEGAQRNITIPAGQSDLTLSLICGIDSTFGEGVFLKELEFTMRIPDTLGTPAFTLGNNAGTEATISATPDQSSSGYENTVYAVKVSGAQFADGDVVLKCTFQDVSPQWYPVGGIYNVKATYQQVAETGAPVEPAAVWGDLYLNVLEFHAGDPTTVTLMPGGIATSSSHLFASGWQRGNHLLMTENGCDVVYQTVDSPASLSLQLTPGANQQYYKRTTISLYRGDTAGDAAGGTPLCEDIVYEDGASYATMDALTKAHPITQSLPADTAGSYYVTAVVKTLYAAGSSSEEKTETAVVKVTTLEKNENLYGTTLDGKTVVGYAGSESVMTLPAQIGGTPVKSISPLADGVQRGTTEIVVSEGIENLLDNAFANFKDAQRITLPKTIKSVGANALSTGGGELTLRIESMDAQAPAFAENAVDLTHTHLTVECYGESAAYAWASGLKTQASDKVTIVRLDDTDALRLEVKNKEGNSLGVDAFSAVEWFRKGSDQPISQGSTSYTPPEGEEISEDAPYICRVTFQTATRATYLVPAQIDILFTQRGIKTVVLQPRDKTVKLKGRFVPSEINTPEFSAILTIKKPDGEMQDILTVNKTTGEFTYEMDQFFLADLTADNGQGRRLTLYDVQSRGADESGVVDLGEIRLPDRAFRRTVYSESYANFTEYRAIRNLFYYGNSVSVLTDQTGAEVPRTDYAIVPSSSWTSVGDSVYYTANFKVIFGDAFAEKYAVGDRFTLKMDGTQPRYDMTPVEFTLQSVDEDVAYLNPTFETLAYFNGAYGTNHFLFKEGETELYRATTISGRGFHVAAGTYTLISIRDNPYVDQIDHPDALEELGIEPQYYSKKTVVLEGGKDYNAQSAPEFMENTITLTAEAGAAQQFGGMVPIYIHYYDQLAEEFGKTSSAKISLYTNASASSDGSLPLYRINGRYAFSADSSVTEKVSLTSGGWHSERLDLSVSGASANLVLYAKPTGRYLYIQASNDANETIARAALELPRQSISLADVKSINSEESGNLHLYTILNPETGETFSAKLYIDGAFVQEFPNLQTSGTGENLIPYTLTRYRDGAASHSIQVEVWRNKTGSDPECLWTSEPQPVLLLAEDQDAPSPQKLYIRMTSVNKNGAASVKAQKTLDLVNGRYGNLSYTTYPWELDTDNAFNVDMVFDYQLTMEHPELVRNDRVTMNIYSGKENKPDITDLTLMRNPVTGTFDGTLTLPAGTCKLADIPFGYDLIYYDDGAAASLSMDQVIGQVQAGLEKRQELMTSQVQPEDMLSMTPVDMELLEHILGDADEALTEEEKQRVRDIYAAYNELCRTYEEGVSAVKDALKDGAETMGYEGALENEEDLIDFLNSIAHNEMNLAQLPHEELPSAEELLNSGYRQVPGSDIYVYADSISRQTSVIDLESGTWCGNGAAPQLMTSSLGGEAVDMLMVFNEYYSTAMTLVDVVLERAEEIIEAYEKLARTYLLDEVMADARLRKMLEEQTTYFDLKKMAALTEVEHLREQIRTARLNVQAARTFDVTAIQKAKAALAPLTQMKAVQLLQKLPIGNIMGVVGLISDVITLFETSEYQYNKVKSLDGEIKLAESYLARIKRAVASGCLGDDATAFQAVAECERRVEELCEDARDAQDWVLSFMVSRVAVYVADITGTALQFVGAARISLVVGTVSFAAGNVSELGCRMGIELNQKAVDEAWPDVVDACLKPIEKGECEGGGPEEDGSDDEEDDENRPLLPSVPGGDGSGDGSSDGSGDGDIGGVSRPEISMPFVPRIDPAGYVYEAVASNRISGATATAYYRNGSDETKWDAEEADQENPLTTDGEGGYSWFTPPGDWLVKVTKDGYLPADSKSDPAAEDGWLPVPPPQVNVNIGLVSAAAPSVENCAAAADRVRVVFSQYMDAARLRDGDLVSVTQDGSAVPVTVSFEDAEESPTQPGTMYGRVMKLTRSDGQSFAGSIVVHIKQAAKNYAAHEMAADYTSAPLTVGALVGGLEHSYPNRFVTEIGASGTIAVQVVDTAGNPMPGVTVTARQTVGGTLEFSTSAVSDSNGRAVFSYRGRSSGYDTLIFTADTVSTEMQTRVSAMDTSAPAKPTANLSDYAVVTKGTQLIISAQEGAIIRYTTDNTCPCTDAALTYTGPITLTESGFYRIAAWTQSGGYSERLNLHITVTDAQPPSGEGNGGGGSGSTAFGVTTDKPKNGTITVSPKYASKGDIVTITVTPDEDYELDTLHVTDKDGDQIKVTEKSDGKFIFTMPGSKVSVEAWFKRASGGSEVPAFVDVPADAYYVDAVTWAVEQGITAGTSATTFSPNVSCTRAQMVTFLWRANGSPKATAANSFTDVSADSYYYDAVLWAAEKGITAGTSATTFSPDATLTRSQAVTFLYRAAGSPAASNSSFNDVAADAYYANAVAWAVSEGVTAGTGGNNFTPNADCTRAQIVTFLYRSTQ